MRACVGSVLLASIGVALAVGAIAGSSNGQAPSFAAAKSYAAGKAPDSPAIADLNGDGRPDLAVTNFHSNSVSVLLNRGGGSFQAKRSYATRAGLVAAPLQIADLNGDGKQDLVTANHAAHTSSVSVLLNRGDGSFEAKRDYATGKAPNALWFTDSLAIGDLNGDDKPDLVTASPGTYLHPGKTLSVLLNRGDGSFEAKRDYATGREPHSLAIGDLNGDGRPDLAVANASSRTVSVLLNRGDGSFEAKHDYASEGSPGTPHLLRLADLNGDGMPDMLFISEITLEPSLVVMLNNGDGSFQASHYYETRPTGPDTGSTAAESVAIADLNGDGTPDVATRVIQEYNDSEDYRGTVSLFLNKGDGTFKERRYTTGHKTGRTRSDSNIVASDLNGDGRPDLATRVGRISVLVNRGDGSFQATVEYPGGRFVSGPLASGDLNGDDKPDLVTLGERSLHVLINTPGLCNVQGVVGMTPAAAKRELARVNCRVGKVRRLYSKRVKKGRVISQRPNFGAVVRGGGKVNLVVSRGRPS